LPFIGLFTIFRRFAAAGIFWGLILPTTQKKYNSQVGISEKSALPKTKTKLQSNRVKEASLSAHLDARFRGHDTIVIFVMFL